jgi:hypothetical protein
VVPADGRCRPGFRGEGIGCVILSVVRAEAVC